MITSRLPRGLLKEYAQVLSVLLRSLDMTAIIFAGWITYIYKFDSFYLTQDYTIALGIAALFTCLVFSFFRLYDSMRALSILEYMARLTQAVATLLILLAGVAFFTKTGEHFSRSWFIAWACLSLALLFFLRGGLLILLHLMRARGWNERRVVIMGAGEIGQKLASTIEQAGWTGFRVLAFFDDNTLKDEASIQSIPVYKTPDKLSDYIVEYQVDEIWIALPLRAEARVKEILYQLRHLTVTTRFILDIFGMDLMNHSISELAGFSVLNIRSTPMIGIKRLIKSLEDRVLAAMIVCLTSPLWLVIMCLIKLDSPGPIFYRQQRIGWNGQPFDILKFRTMPVDVEKESGPAWAKPNEKRSTAIGGFLRRTSLDELPQFINVLKGEMSIVGPRPERPFFVEQFKEKIPRYMQKHYMKAGITGWAQVNGWRGNTDLEKRIEFDLYYIEHWSLSLDLKIIFLTIFKGFFNKNAY